MTIYFEFVTGYCCGILGGIAITLCYWLKHEISHNQNNMYSPENRGGDK